MSREDLEVNRLVQEFNSWTSCIHEPVCAYSTSLTYNDAAFYLAAEVCAGFSSDNKARRLSLETFCV